MNIQKCYQASFNIGNIEVWASELYLEKESVLIEIEESTEDIADTISYRTISLSDIEISVILNKAIISLRKYGMFKDKKNEFIFFILEQIIWKDIEDRNKFTKTIKFKDVAN